MLLSRDSHVSSLTRLFVHLPQMSWSWCLESRRKTGRMKVFPLTCLADVDLFLALVDCVKADHGFNIDSRSIRNLLEVLNSLSLNDRRTFLQFLTGSPKLPIGGTFLFYLRDLIFQASRSCYLPSRSSADLTNRH